MQDEQDAVRAIEEATAKLGAGTPTAEKPGEESNAPQNETQTTEQIPAPPSKPEGETPQDKPEDDDLPDLKPGEHPQADNFRRLREIAKQEKQQRRDLEKKLKDLETRQSVEKTMPVADPKPQTQDEPSSTPPVETVVSVISKAYQGEYEGRSQEILEQAKAHLADYSPQELLKMLNKARAGEYGDVSHDVAEAIRSELSVAQTSYESRREQERFAQQQREAATQTFNEVVKEYPDMNNPQSEFRKNFDGIVRELIGEVDQTGRITKPGLAPILSQIPGTMRYIAHLADYKNIKSQYDAMKKELDALKKKHNYILSPDTSSRGAGAPQKDSLDELREQIRAGFEFLRTGG